MRLKSTLLVLTLLLSGCNLPNTLPTEEAIGTETVLNTQVLTGGAKPTVPHGAQVIGSDGRLITSSGGNVIAAGGGNVIAAGGGNVIAAGGGNVIAAGGGNLTQSASAPAAGVIAAGGGNVIAAGGGNVIAAGGGNLIATSSSQVIAAGGMNLVSGSGGGLTPDAPVTGSMPGGAVPLASGTIAGQVLAPGALAASAEALLPVGQTYVGVYDLQGNPVGTPVQADAQGNFQLADVPALKLFCLRTQFTINDKQYYLSTLVRVEAPNVTAKLTPVSTMAEARFFKKANGAAPADDFIGEPYLDAFWDAIKDDNGDVPADALYATADLDTRSAAYDALKLHHPSSFTNDIDAAFDGTATRTVAGTTMGLGGTTAGGGVISDM